MMRATIVKTRPPQIDLGQLAKDVMRPWADAYESWRSGVVSVLERPRKSGDCCSKCAPDDCRCRCCVADSDLLIEARTGERRVVPITIENHWRRERAIELELSSWTTVDGAKVTGQIVTPASFTLDPCGEKEVVLVVEIAADETTEGQRLGDVKDCEVSYADLRVKGCDVRPIRIAVAILPRSCDDFVIDCLCGCC